MFYLNEVINPFLSVKQWKNSGKIPRQSAQVGALTAIVLGDANS